MSNRVFVSSMVLAAALAVVVWGKEAEAATPAALPDPIDSCSFLSTAEVQALIGGPVGEPKKKDRVSRSRKHWSSICTYFSEPRKTSLAITVQPHGREVGGAEALARHEAGIKAAIGSDFKLETISGVGEAAGWDGSTKQLTVFQGPYLLLFTIASPTLESRAALEIEKKVAGRAVAKLPR